MEICLESVVKVIHHQQGDYIKAVNYGAIDKKGYLSPYNKII